MSWALLLEPFGYAYMTNAMWVATLVGAVCAFLSCFLMLKGWSLIGDALSHSIVPGVAGAYMLGLPFSAGAFFAGLMAAGAIGFLNRHTRLKPDVIIGLIFSTFFGLGLFMVSVSPTSVNIQTIVLGNILAVTPGDMLQLVIIGAVTLTVLLLKWKDLLVIFFDEAHARSVGLHPGPMKLIFFALLAACTVAAMQTVGAFLVIALIVTPGATAYLLSDRFGHVIIIATVIGAVSSFIGVYASYFLDGATGAVVVLVQAALFSLAFLFPHPPATSCPFPIPFSTMDLDTLLLPLQFDFMRDALLMAAVVAVPCALLSCFLVLKGWALMGDAISHAVFPGVVIAYMIGIPLAVGAFVAGMGCALLTGYVNEHSRIKQDTVMGVVFSSMFALGLLLYVWARSEVHLEHILFGDVLGTSPQDLLESGSIALVVAGWISLKWRDLMLQSFDPVQARTAGLPVRLLHYALLAAVSLAVVGALKSVGIVLTISLLIAPGAIARLLTRTFGRMLVVAVLLTVVTSLVGVYLAFFLDSAPAPTIVLLLALQFIVALGISTRRERRAQASLSLPDRLPVQEPPWKPETR